MPIPAIVGALGSIGRVAAMAGSALGAAGAGAAEGTLLARGAQVAKTLNTVSNALMMTQYGAQAAGSAISGLAKMMMPMAPLVGIVTRGLNWFVSAVTNIGNSVAGFVALASPVHVQKFKLATDDLVATIGHMLLPVMEYGTELVRAFADSMMPLIRPAQELLSALFKPLTALMPTLANMGGAVARALGALIRIVTPFLNVFGQIFELIGKIVGTGVEMVFHVLAVNLEVFAAVMKPFLDILVIGLEAVNRVMERALRWVRAFLRLPTVAGKSTGMAARPATFSSVEEYGRKAQQAAFSLGKSPEQEMAQGVINIHKLLGDVKRDVVAAINNLPSNIGDAVAKALPNARKAVQDFRDRVANTAGQAGQQIGAFFSGVGP